ncbi:Ig-like domain-containing protein [Paenibacillus lemnae]|uniref:Ig-like domain-containing protein n=1 Tax=Paenibacillus lemnae TaxID=1330551 RepID=UPI001FE51DAA|nr:Ig-like domain-containing protein [Paenibacillus lemnae]
MTVAESTKQLRVLASYEGLSTKKDITNEASWTSSSSKIVKVEGGLLTPLDKGTVTITAKYKTSLTTIKVTSKFAADKLEINQPSQVEYKLGSADVPIKALADGTVDVTSDAAWSTSDNTVVTVTEGTLKLVGKGTAVIKAAYKGLEASFKVKVVSPYEKLSISPGENLEMLVGDDPQQLQVYAQAGVDSQPVEVTNLAEFKSSHNSVIEIKDGKLVPVGLGKAVITASYLGTSTSVDVYVRNPYEALILSEPSFIKNPVLFIKDEVKIETSVRNVATESIPVTAEWSSSNPLAVTVDQGILKARAAGTSTIKVSYRGISKEFKVTVYPTVAKFQIEKDILELLRGESVSVPVVKGVLLDDETHDFSSQVTWATGNEEVVVIENGKIKAKGEGETIVTGTIGSREAAQISVKVQERVLLLLPSVEEYQLITGTSVELPAVNAVFENGAEEDITSEIIWTISGKAAVIKDNTMKGLIAGTAVLEGIYLNEKIKIKASVEQEIVKFVVEPETIELNIKKSKAIKVKGYYANGKYVTLSSKMNWSSSNPEVAVISGSSSVKAVSEGTAEVTGTYQGKEVKVRVSVVPKLTGLTASEKKLNLQPGDTKTVTLTAAYDTGTTGIVTDSALWTSSNPSVAKVNAGKIEVSGKGTARIKAKLDSKTVTITVSVK